MPATLACMAVAIAACNPPPDPLDLQAAVNAEVDAIAGGGRYVEPTAEELATVRQAMAALCSDSGRANALLEPLGYAATAFTDDALGGGTLHLVREDADPAAGRRGWGLYVIDCDAPAAPVIEVPHPVSDTGTEQLGLQLFARADAGALLIAGSKRGPDGAPSDVAHAAASVFSTIHLGLLTEDRQVVQLHGFAAAEHVDLTQQAVVSSGSTDPEHGSLAQAVSGTLRAAGVGVCLFTASDPCSD